MTAVADAKTVIETLIGRTLSNDQLQRIGQRYKRLDDGGVEIEIPSGLGVYADPNNPTNEELAQTFLDFTLALSKEAVRSVAKIEEKEAINAENAADAVKQRIEDAGVVAEGDLT
jgi:wyosine [tRNA(Phe)-imidazoG37] synthetase (radical SAM superfamily)